MEEKIRLASLSFVYSPGTPFENRVLSGIDFSIGEGEIFGLLGETGAGKTTLAQIIGGLLKGYRGELDINYSVKNDGIRCGYVFQYPEHQLFADTVYEDISYGLLERGVDRQETRKRVEQVCSMLNISPSCLNRSPFALSGGETRKVALAGVLVLNPEILILDEPTVGLDPVSRSALIRNLEIVHARKGLTMIIITHDLALVEFMHRLCVLSSGKVVFRGEPAGLFRDSALLKRLNLKRPLHLEAAYRVASEQEVKNLWGYKGSLELIGNRLGKKR